MRKLMLLKYIVPVIVPLLLCFPSNGQTKAAIFNKETPLTWMGIDFSEARYFGDTGTVSSSEMKILFSKINYLIQAESEKYNLSKTFKKSLYSYSLSMVRHRNDSMDDSKIISNNETVFLQLDSVKIAAMVSDFETGNVNGLAVVFIMEEINKSKEEAAMWVTFFNATEKQVLLTARLTGAASGIGFRNHWASSINDVMSKIASREYKKWQLAASTEK